MRLNERLSIAGKHFLNADLSLAVKSLTGGTEMLPELFNAGNYREGSNYWNIFEGENSHHFRWADHKSSLTAYDKCPPIAAIINRKAQAYINGKTWVLNTQGKESNTADAKKLKALFTRPNPLQSGKQFEAQGYIYQQLFGYTIVLIIKPVGFKDPMDAKSMWNIPPTMIDIEETNKLFYQSDQTGIIKEIVLTYKGARTKIAVEDILIIKDFSPSFHSLILPQSRIKALEMPINNIIGAYESRNVLINYRGALGMITSDPGKGDYANMPMTPEEKTALQDDFKRYGIRNRQWQFILTTASVKWQQMGVATRDLMLFEEVEADTMAICDSFNYPYRLMSTNHSNSLGGSDAKEFKAMLYQDGVIPEAESINEQWNQFFKTAEKSIRLDKDFSHIPVLQTDEAHKMTARRTRNEAYEKEWLNDLITRNMWRVANGEDPIQGDDILRSQIVTESSEPLAVSIGVGGVQSLISVLTAPISEDAKRNTLEIVFGIPPADAARMVSETEQTNNNGNQQGNAQPTQSAAEEN